MKIGGTFNGTGADLYLCIGFLPDFVTVWNLEGTQGIKLVWNKGMQSVSEVVEGLVFTGADVAAAALTKGNGLLPFYGGTSLTATQAGTTTYGEGVYLKRDDLDYKFYNDDAPTGVGDAVSTSIDTWTLTTSANNTGKFNSNVNGTYIGEGSPICIEGKWYKIVTLSNDGDADDDVLLSHSAKSGRIDAIHGMYDYKPMLANETTRNGFIISNTDVNVDGQLCFFEAGQYSM